MKRLAMPPIVLTLALWTALALAAALPAGCTASFSALDQLKQTSAQLHESADVAKAATEAAGIEVARLQAEAATMPAGAEKDAVLSRLEQVQAILEQSADVAAKAAAVAATLDEEMGKAQDKLDAAIAVANTVQRNSDLVPQPWGNYLGLGAGLVAGALGLWKSARTRGIAAAVIKSVNPIMTAALSGMTDGERAQIDLLQGKAGKALVNAVTKPPT